MNRKLVLVHGRSQEHKDAAALKAEWLSAWDEGLHANGFKRPIPDSDITFPYYGDTLYDLVQGAPGGNVADVILRGDVAEDAAEKEFVLSVLQEVRKHSGITDEQIMVQVGDEAIEKGPLNWGWVRGIVQALDQHVPLASGVRMMLATYDVYQYLYNPGIRDKIEVGVREALAAEAETVVVGHSLGSVVAYNLLRRDGPKFGWKVPLYVTVGCPLAITAIRKALSPIAHPACVGCWFNAMDSRDIVALYPLNQTRFGINPAVENKINVENQTPNRHGIAGYLNDPVIAKRIYDALVI